MRSASAACGDGNCLVSARALQSSLRPASGVKLPCGDDRRALLRLWVHVWQQCLLKMQAASCEPKCD